MPAEAAQSSIVLEDSTGSIANADNALMKDLAKRRLGLGGKLKKAAILKNFKLHTVLSFLKLALHTGKLKRRISVQLQLVKGPIAADVIVTRSVSTTTTTKLLRGLFLEKLMTWHCLDPGGKYGQCVKYKEINDINTRVFVSDRVCNSDALGHVLQGLQSAASGTGSKLALVATTNKDETMTQAKARIANGYGTECTFLTVKSEKAEFPGLRNVLNYSRFHQMVCKIVRAGSFTGCGGHRRWHWQAIFP